VTRTSSPEQITGIALLIQDEMRECYLDYAMSVIVGRALPDVRDGLKPVHRRVLYAMHMLGNYHNKPFLKSASVVGMLLVSITHMVTLLFIKLLFVLLKISQ
jgi:DNA gyrase/topoisomerase IV subunit A